MSLQIIARKLLKDFSEAYIRPLTISNVKSIDEYMRLLTEDKRWTFGGTMASGPHADIYMKPDDPVSYATLSAFSGLSDNWKDKEDTVNWDSASGRHHIYVGDDYDVTITAWLKPLSNFVKSRKELFNRGHTRFDKIQIRILGDMDFLKENFDEIKSRYDASYVLAKHNNLQGGHLFRKVPEQKASGSVVLLR